MVFSAGDSNEWITQTDTQEDVSDKSRSEDAADHSIDLVDIDIDAGNSDDDIIIINNINNNDLQRKNDKIQPKIFCNKLRKGVTAKKVNKSFTTLKDGIRENKPVEQATKSFINIKDRISENERIDNVSQSFAKLRDSIKENENINNIKASFVNMRETVRVSVRDNSSSLNESVTNIQYSIRENKRVDNVSKAFANINNRISENERIDNMNQSVVKLRDDIKENENKIRETIVTVWESAKKWWDASSNSLLTYWKISSYKKRLLIILSMGIILLLFIIIVGAAVGERTTPGNLFPLIPSAAPSGGNSTQPFAISSTSEPTISLAQSNLSTNYPSLKPSLISSISYEPSGLPSNQPSNTVSSNPTYMPTKIIQPVAIPLILPFNSSSESLSKTITTFCVIADVPYNEKEVEELPEQISTQMEGCEFLIHLGDIFTGDTVCSIEDYSIIQEIMLESHLPVFVVPGDNEWNDCRRQDIDAGWDHWMDHFLEFENNWNHTFTILRQPHYEENFYFIHKRTLFIGLNIVAGRVHNATEWKTRLQSEYRWVKDIMELNLNDMKIADGAILMAHAHPSEDHREFFNPFRIFMKNELENKFPVLYLHGDGHNFLHTPNFHNQPNYLRIQHEGGTNEPVLKIMSGPRRTGHRATAYNAYQYDRQLHLLNNIPED